MQELILDLDTKQIDNMDSFNARGMVNIRVYDKDKKLVQTIENHNLIVKVGRSELIKKIAGTSSLGAVTKCGVGSGGATVANPFSPVAPVDGDTALYTPVLTQNIGSNVVTLTGSNPQVTFTTLFTCAQVNSLVNECALFYSDGATMFARYTFQTVSLLNTSGFSMEIDWTIQF